MNQESKQRILNEAIRIGDQLLSGAERDENGLYWKTISVDRVDNHRIMWQTGEGVYSGVSGIILFFLELYKQTHNMEYLDSAVESTRWVDHFCQYNPTNSYSFFAGRMGVAYTMLRMAELMEDERYLEKALKLVRDCLTFLEKSNAVDDLLGGTSGTLLGLLHLHAATGEKWLLRAIDTFTAHLLNNLHHGPVGVYWDRSHQQIHGLCGLSHGAAGVGFVFLELGYYFGNKAFFEMAEQAFLYESYYYDGHKRNWPDFRKSIENAEKYKGFREAYIRGDLDFFTKGLDLNAWCHGAAGIGLSRLRALELLKKPLYEDDVKNAVARTVASHVEGENRRPTFTLCHGAGGNAELFLEAYKLFRDRTYLSLAEKVALNALNFRKKKGSYLSGYSMTLEEDTSLFMGSAGIGYFYLKVLEPLEVPSILLPKVSSFLKEREGVSEYPYITISATDMRKIVMEKVFGRTLFALENIVPGGSNALPDEKHEKDTGFSKEVFIEDVENRLSSLPQRERAYVADVFALELEKVRMDDAARSHTLLHIEAVTYAEQAKELLQIEDKLFLDLKLILNRRIRIKWAPSEWSFANSDRIENPDLERPGYNVMLKLTAGGVVEESLSTFAYVVLALFQGGAYVKTVVEEVVDSFGPVSLEQTETIKRNVIQQVREAVAAGILLEDMKERRLKTKN